MLTGFIRNDKFTYNDGYATNLCDCQRPINFFFSKKIIHTWTHFFLARFWIYWGFDKKGVQLICDSWRRARKENQQDTSLNWNRWIKWKYEIREQNTLNGVQCALCNFSVFIYINSSLYIFSSDKSLQICASISFVIQRFALTYVHHFIFLCFAFSSVFFN